jgi:Flp pilus assembly pilin Flp
MFQYLYSLIHRDERGQGLAEYALILALIALAAIVALMMLGADILGTLSYIGATIQKSRP